ncbi:outer membrane protein transport protein [Vibrio coralliilyticus]|uniref:outer membrane protein transport protein n=1 Tax=Vibrio TaxID=662 RepID=UPI0004FFE275|nr:MULTISPECIES: outer membrane protein transport protein [Vibrio]KFI10607.1 aromatic hydrocarbon degradation protein [Vibrio sp. B183]NOI18298.1 transporter [Vibrio coralliilyticus]NRF26296.1 outer membrane protein transport protein [Vibrio coralliilyticus]NRF80485.1 outer membrane protein transport protein [Vibrio coralliilyticus]WFB47185.1 outer membrane protein transport protein [Vibrio coralliilyticus]
MKKLVIYTLPLVALQSHAAGFQLNAQSATGLGRAYAGDAIIADNASVVAKNAAAMSLIDKPMISVGAVNIASQVDFSNIRYTPPSSTTQEIGDTGLDNNTFIPNAHVVYPLEGTDWTLGATVHSNFGTDVEFEDSFEAPIFGGKTYLSSINAGFSAAYQLNEAWSLGGGIDIIYGEGEISRTPNSANPLRIDADGIGLGFNLGVAYVVDENNRFGLSYRYSPELTAEGDVYAWEQGKTDSVDIPLPDIIEFSGYHKLNAKWAAHYSLQYVAWSEFDKLTSENYSASIKDYEWKNAGHVSVGVTHYLNKDIELRAGYMYDLSPVDQISSLSIPDTDRHWFTFGGSYAATDQLTLDLSVGYLTGEQAAINESQTVVDEYNIEATVNTSAWLVGAQLNYAF